jgi:RimJ/RimL family protein N-acetyltransferase
MLKGEKINIRPLEPEDLELVKSWNNDPEFKGPFEPIECNSLEDLKGWYHSEHESKWYLVEKKDGEPVGQIMNKIKADYYTIGYIIHHKHREKGYGTEAVKLMVDFLFLSTPTERIEAQASPGNIASIKLLEKAGFKHEGTIRKALFVQGRYLDEAIYGILREDGKAPNYSRCKLLEN